MKDIKCSLSDSISSLLRDSSEERPVHYSVFVKSFVDSGKCTNDQLVAAMNSLLVPFGEVRGMNHNFWIEPLHKARK